MVDSNQYTTIMYSIDKYSIRTSTWTLIVTFGKNLWTSLGVTAVHAWHPAKQTNVIEMSQLHTRSHRSRSAVLVTVMMVDHLPGLKPTSWTKVGLQAQKRWENLVMRVSRYSPLSSGAWMCLKKSLSALGRNWLLKLWSVTSSSRTSRLQIR